MRVAKSPIARRLGNLGAALSAFVLTSAAGLTGCTTTNCQTYAAAALRVTVVDAAGKRLCRASVTVTDGAFSAPLASDFGDSTACAYVGPYERAGTYSIEVRSGARTKMLDGVKVTADACHVRPREVSITIDQ